MLISYDKRFIFIHVTNTGGTSIKKALEEYANEPKKFKVNRPLKTVNGKPNLLYDIWSSALLHAKAREVKRELSEEVYNNFYKFAFVRNPWDWQVSMYHFILREESHIRHQLVRSMHNFDEYIEWLISEKNPFPKGTSKFQKDHVTDNDGELIVDFIGRYEKLEQDFDNICHLLNITALLPPSKNMVKRDYRLFYTKKSEKIIEEYFRQDIELFGYTFDNS